jgi:hypothetical protein
MNLFEAVKEAGLGGTVRRESETTSGPSFKVAREGLVSFESEPRVVAPTFGWLTSEDWTAQRPIPRKWRVLVENGEIRSAPVDIVTNTIMVREVIE